MKNVLCERRKKKQKKKTAIIRQTWQTLRLQRQTRRLMAQSGGPQQVTLQITNDCKLLDIISALFIFEEEFSSGIACAMTRGKDKMLSSSTASGGMFKLLNAKIKDQGTTLLLNLVAYLTAYSGPTMMAVIPLKWVFEEFSDSLSLQCYTCKTLFLSGFIVQNASCHSDQNERLKSKLNMCNSVF